MVSSTSDPINITRYHPKSGLKRSIDVRWAGMSFRFHSCPLYLRADVRSAEQWPSIKNESFLGSYICPCGSVCSRRIATALFRLSGGCHVNRAIDWLVRNRLLAPGYGLQR